MEYTIRGDVMPVLQIRLRKGEAIYTESGGMAWMTEGIAMKTSGRGGLGKMIGRALSGESLFLTTYTAEADNVAIAFTPEAMGKIIPLNLAAGNTMILQKDAFMCAEDSVEMAMHFRKKLGAGLFGGEGFILQKVTGPGVVFAEIIGEVVEYDLKPGQRLKVDPGHLAMYEPSVNYDIQMVKGVKNILFGGEGLFLATLTGPGKVWLQTMPISNLASRIAQAIPGKGGGSKSAGGLLGDIAGGFLDNI
ncbi:MAG: TIGR00266 family protein [Anaerolineae bacterium]|nr:MAG: TIGR00266 family protein [Anaerolineae bacterium]